MSSIKNFRVILVCHEQNFSDIYFVDFESVHQKYLYIWNIHIDIFATHNVL